MKSHKTHPQYILSNIRVLSSTAWHQLTAPAGPSPYIAGSWLLVRGQTALRVLERGHLPTCPTSLSADSPAHQCARSATLRLNIDMSLTVSRTTSPTSIIISTDKYNPIRSVPQIHVNTSIATYIVPMAGNLCAKCSAAKPHGQFLVSVPRGKVYVVKCVMIVMFMKACRKVMNK